MTGRGVMIALVAVSTGGCPDPGDVGEPQACPHPPASGVASSSSAAPKTAASASPPAPVSARRAQILPEVVDPDPLTTGSMKPELDPAIACAKPLRPGRRLPSGASPRVRSLYESCRASLQAGHDLGTATQAPTPEGPHDPSGLRACTFLARILDAGYGAPENALLATNLAARACALGELGSCTLLGQASLDGAGAVLDPACGEAVLRWTCARDGADACADLGSLEARGELVPRDPADARSLFERACEKGSYEGCIELSRLVGPTDPPRRLNIDEHALSLAEAGCQGGDGKACRDVAWLYDPKMNGSAFSKELKAAHPDPKKANAFEIMACRFALTSGCEAGADTIQLLEDLCKKGDFERCIDLAFERGAEGGAPFAPRDVKNIEAACIGGSSRGCWALGSKHSPSVYETACAGGELGACRPILHDGPEVTPTLEQSKKACDQGSAMDCSELGLRAMKAGSVSEAVHLFERACPSIRSRRDYRDVDAIACREAGRHYRKGDGVARDPERAVELLLDGCYAEGRTNPRGEGCADLAEMYDTGDGVPPDRDRATDLWAALCNAQRKGCDEVHARTKERAHE